jgi:hypothetical protein
MISSLRSRLIYVLSIPDQQPQQQAPVLDQVRDLAVAIMIYRWITLNGMMDVLYSQRSTRAICSPRPYQMLIRPRLQLRQSTFI